MKKFYKTVCLALALSIFALLFTGCEKKPGLYAWYGGKMDVDTVMTIRVDGGDGEKVYEGMIVGESARNEDLVINVCKKKHITNIRASGSDDALKLTPPITLSLEQALEFIADDELVEVTPKTIRLRKKILNSELRAKDRARKDS